MIRKRKIIILQSKFYIYRKPAMNTIDNESCGLWLLCSCVMCLTVCLCVCVYASRHKVWMLSIFLSLLFSIANQWLCGAQLFITTNNNSKLVDRAAISIHYHFNWNFIDNNDLHIFCISIGLYYIERQGTRWLQEQQQQQQQLPSSFIAFCTRGWNESIGERVAFIAATSSFMQMWHQSHLKQ